MEPFTRTPRTTPIKAGDASGQDLVVSIRRTFKIDPSIL